MNSSGGPVILFLSFMIEISDRQREIGVSLIVTKEEHSTKHRSESNSNEGRV